MSLRVLDTDRYGRIVAELVLKHGPVLNHEIARAGLAWWFGRYAPNDRELETLEREARNPRRGLWGDDAPVPPWEYRRR